MKALRIRINLFDAFDIYLRLPHSICLRALSQGSFLQVLADMIISNESRIVRSGVVSNFKKPRQYVATISIRHKDMLLVDGITASMKSWLETSVDIHHDLPTFVGLSSLDNHSCNISVLVTPSTAYAHFF